MLSSGRQAALAMHEACSNLISEISQLQDNWGREEGGFWFGFLGGGEGNFPFVNQLGNVVF